MYKRLNIGAFNWPRSADEAVEISQEEYERLMQGFEVIAKRPITEMKHPQRSDILHFLVKKYQICFNIVDSRMKKPVVSDFFIELSTVRMTNEGNLRIRKKHLYLL